MAGASWYGVDMNTSYPPEAEEGDFPGPGATSVDRRGVPRRRGRPPGRLGKGTMIYLLDSDRELLLKISKRLRLSLSSTIAICVREKYESCRTAYD